MTKVVKQHLPSIGKRDLEIAKRIVNAYCSSSSLYFYAAMQTGEQMKNPAIWEFSEQNIADTLMRLESVFPKYASSTPTFWAKRHAHYQRKS